MQVTFTKGEHSDEALAIFGSRLSTFHDFSSLYALFGNNWESVLCTDGTRAMLNVIQRNPIGQTGLCDVEPFYGYSGPLLSHEDSTFVQAALDEYRAACRREGIIAEVIRFQPDKMNHLPFVDLSGIEINEARQIAYVQTKGRDADSLLNSYNSNCRRQIRSAQKRLNFKRFPGSTADWKLFASLNGKSLDRNKAAARWYFDIDVYERLRRAERVSLWGVFDDDIDSNLLASTVVFEAEDMVHTLFVANAEPNVLKGACDLLMHGVIEFFSERGVPEICLGGGRTNENDDALLNFKKKFAGNYLRPLHIGFIAHDEDAISRLNTETCPTDPLTVESKPTNELIRRFMVYRSNPKFVNQGEYPRLSMHRFAAG